MTAKMIDGKAIAAQIKSEVKDEVKRLKAQGVDPCLAAVLAIDFPVSLGACRGNHLVHHE